MNVFYSVSLVIFLAFLGILLVRYVNITVDKEFRSLARAASDGEFRVDELDRLDRLVAPQLPLPDRLQPLSGPLSAGRGVAPAILIVLGVILLWGGGPAAEDREKWLIGGLCALGLAAVVMLVTLRRRKWERTARLLRYRADLRRMNDDRQGSADDLRELLRLTPWDDAAWAELSDDLAGLGDLPGALDAMGQAARLDPNYDEYRMLEASLAIRLDRTDQARTAIEVWERMDRVKADDPRPALYRAALELAEGDRRKAEDTLREAIGDQPNEDCLACVDADSVLDGIKDLLPGRE